MAQETTDEEMAAAWEASVASGDGANDADAWEASGGQGGGAPLRSLRAGGRGGRPRPRTRPHYEDERRPRSRRSRETAGEAFLKSAMRQAGSTLVREVMRGILGGMRRR